VQPADVRLYEDLGGFDAIKPVFEELLEDYNTKKKSMDLVFFDDALEHLTRIHRVLRLRQVQPWQTLPIVPAARSLRSIE
jgi:hypothetical protein